MADGILQTIFSSPVEPEDIGVNLATTANLLYWLCFIVCYASIAKPKSNYSETLVSFAKLMAAWIAYRYLWLTMFCSPIRHLVSIVSPSPAIANSVYLTLLIVIPVLLTYGAYFLAEKKKIGWKKVFSLFNRYVGTKVIKIFHRVTGDKFRGFFSSFTIGHQCPSISASSARGSRSGAGDGRSRSGSRSRSRSRSQSGSRSRSRSRSASSCRPSRSRSKSRARSRSGSRRQSVDRRSRSRSQANRSRSRSGGCQPRTSTRSRSRSSGRRSRSPAPRRSASRSRSPSPSRSARSSCAKRC